MIISDYSIPYQRGFRLEATQDIPVICTFAMLSKPTEVGVSHNSSQVLQVAQFALCTMSFFSVLAQFALRSMPFF